MHEKLCKKMILAGSTDIENPWNHETAIDHKASIQLGIKVDCVNTFGNLLGTVKELEKGTAIVSLSSGVDARLSYWDIYPINPTH
jgi:hypothetical protein